MKNKVYAIEAIPNGSLFLHLPNFHLLAWREGGVMKAHVLDFDLWVFSQNRDDKKAMEEVFKSSQDITLAFIMTHLRDGRVKDLYSNGVKNSGDWEKFSIENNREKIKALEASYKEFMKDPKTAIEKTGTQLIALNNLDNDSLADIKEALNRLSSMNPKTASDLAGKILMLVASVYDLQPASIPQR